MSKPIVKEYRDFDIVFIICELKSFINLLFFHNIVDPQYPVRHCRVSLILGRGYLNHFFPLQYHIS